MPSDHRERVFESMEPRIPRGQVPICGPVEGSRQGREVSPAVIPGLAIQLAIGWRYSDLHLAAGAIDEDPVRGAEDVLIVERIKELLLG